MTKGCLGGGTHQDAIPQEERLYSAAQTARLFCGAAPLWRPRWRRQQVSALTCSSLGQTDGASHSGAGNLYGGQGKDHTSTPQSATSSPATSRQKLNGSAAEGLEVSLVSSLDDTRELQDLIMDFPTANMPCLKTCWCH